MDLSPLGLTCRDGSGRACRRGARRRARIQLLAACRAAANQGARLVALWLTDERDRERGFCLRVLLQDADGLTLLEHSMPDGDVHYPDLAPFFPRRIACSAPRSTSSACRRTATTSGRGCGWRAWPIDQFPLRRDFVALAKWQPGEEEYAFVKVEGDGVHEIPVGPVHAGIIEPGHFRFQVVGEKVLRLEERLGYVHKGIEKRFEAMTTRERHPPRRPRVRRQHGRLRVGLCAGAGGASPA